ncbi:DUF1707 SHOCT-like domain-containing protein [Actinoalloteichus spitiensis]|uniref:DUF1707 SHOCT-like domain-containing protein n=1 Tax=Actinoalloteichus spitiensis TaxID=252394 RepID=UPI00036579B9|nr:DUF1707 domain-containing protein [Actinoalloteichus spitiensis]
MGEPVSWSEMRASDGDRQRVAERLGKAQADGRLSVSEYDTRLRDALAARTYGELERLTTDLPAPSEEPGVTRGNEGQPGQGRDDQRVAERTGCLPAERRKSDLRRAAEAWASVSAITFTIWLIGFLTGGGTADPWWLWVAGPWGAVILVMALSGAGKRYSD